MGSGFKKYNVYCPVNHRNEDVVVYYIVDGETKAGDFNGCESSYHLCDECKDCRVKALALFDQDAYVGRPNLERMIAQGFPDLSSIATPEK